MRIIYKKPDDLKVIRFFGSKIFGTDDHSLARLVVGTFFLV